MNAIRRDIEPDHDAIAAISQAGYADAPPDAAPPKRKAAGRGAIGNPAVRFDAQSATDFDDGWGSLASDIGDLPRLETTLTRDNAKSVISWNNSPDIGFDRAINPYRGCEHGCIYCFARPTHAYLGYSPGLDFETKLIYKPDVAELLEKELRKPSYAPRTMALGSNTDPYQPVDRTLKLTRSVLEVLDRYNHPVGIVTKSAGVLRDIDILSAMAKRNLVRVYVSITTLDARLARVMEPRAATPARRLHAIAELTRAGVPTGVLAAPMIPGLNDAEMEKILQAAASAGARHASWILLRLPHELKGLFDTWLGEHFPDRASHVLSLIRQTRSGQLSDARFHQRFTGNGAYAELLARRFALAVRQYGFDAARGELDCTRFAVPADRKETTAQMSLF